MNTNNQISLLKKAFFVMLGFLSLIVIISAIISVFFSSPTNTPEPTINKDGIIPNKTNKKDVINKLGEPTNTNTSPFGEILEFPSEYEHYPNQVTINNQDQVSLVKEQIADQQNRAISDFLPKPKSSPVLKVDPSIGDLAPVYIFPEDGVAFVADITGQTVFEIWYFTPTSIDQILNTWGSSLVESETGNSQF